MAWTVFPTAIGPVGIAWSLAGVTALQLPEETAELVAERLLRKKPDAGEQTKPPKRIAAAIASVQRHLDGKPQDFADVLIDFSAVTGFPLAVYQALRTIAPGTTVTYGELAGLAGRPGAARAVGRAMGSNPFPIIVACHRVFAAGGKMGGYTAWGGLETKKKILGLEGWQHPKKNPRTTKAPYPYDHVAAVKHLTAVDPKLGAHVAKIPFALTMNATDGVFAALAEAIVFQQLHGKAAATIFGRVMNLFPEKKLDPSRLLALDEADLRKAGLSGNKYKALVDLSERTVSGEIPTLRQLAKMDDDAIVAALTHVRGIGRWTVEMLLMFRLGRPDVFPTADFGIRKGYARLFHPKKKQDEMPDVAAMVRRAERWKPYRSVASWYLWRATDLETTAC